MKKYLIQTIKIITLALLLNTALVFAVDNIFTAPTAQPPLANVLVPINSSATSQLKAGGLWTGPLTVFGDALFYGHQSVLSSHNLYVSGKMDIGHSAAGQGIDTSTVDLRIINDINPSDPTGPATVNYIKTNSLAHALALPSPFNSNSNLREVCSNSDGVLALCPIHTITPIPINPGGTRTWTSPGVYSFSIPYGYSSITIKTWGGGGGGSGGASSHGLEDNYGFGGYGGTGGAYTTQNITGLTVGTDPIVLTVTVGAGGAGGNGGDTYNNVDNPSSGLIPNTANQGGTSSVALGSTVISSLGGPGGQIATPGNPIGGTNGSAGASGGAGGAGGIDPGCGNSNGQMGNTGAAGGTPGGAGGGGSGARTCGIFGGAHSGGAGGNGANGQVIISWP